MQEILHIINEMSPYLLLGFFLAGLMHAFIPGRYYTRHLAAPNFTSVVKAALFGIPLPLCSCGVIPTAMSLRKEGASKGAVASFLIATPQTGVDSIIATFSLMGLPFAVVRPLAALLTAVFGGGMVNALSDSAAGHADTELEGEQEEKKTFTKKMQTALSYAFVEMMEDIGKWLVIGLVVAGLITVFVPDTWFAMFKGNTWASMLLVLAIAIPMYLCATGSIPIAVALMLKGLTPGAALVLLMAGPACNMASILIVRKVLGTRTLVLYLLSIILGAVAFGWIIDLLQFGGTIDFMGGIVTQSACCVEHDGWFSWLCTIVLALLLVNALILPRFRHGGSHCHCHGCCNENVESLGNEDGSTSSHARIYIIGGMNCNHCRASAEKALRNVPGVHSASVDLATGKAIIEGDASDADIRHAITSLGFSLT